jgi:hypothetical protein
MDQYPYPRNEEKEAEIAQFQILRYLGSTVIKYPRSTEHVEVVDTPVGMHDERYIPVLPSMGSSAQLSSRAIISTRKDYSWSVLYAYQPDLVLPKHIVVANLADDTRGKITKKKYFIDPVTGDVDHETLPRTSRLYRLADGLRSVGYVTQNIALSHIEHTVREKLPSSQPKATPLSGKQMLVNFLHSISRTDQR